MVSADFALGFLAGVVICAPIAWLVVRRAARRTRAAVRRALEARRLAEIGSMTGGLAHEIKNPLSTIGLNAQLLAEAVADLDIGDDEKERLARRVGALRREAERLRDILEDFLRFAGAIRLEPRDVDLNAIAEELVDFYLPQAQRSGVRLRVEAPGQAVRAAADPAYLKQALLNLLINATQAIEEHNAAAPASSEPAGEVVIRTASARDPVGPVRTITVADTGPGIPPERIDEIFTPYFSTKRGGAGLGLAITRRIVEEHGGRIDVRSDPGKGAAFTITLPARTAQSEHGAQAT